MSQKQIFNPGEYLPWERALVDERLAVVHNYKEEQTDPETAEYITLTEGEVLEFNRKWNPFDRLYNDPGYAKSQGLPGLPAMPGLGRFAKFGGGVPPFPKHTGDKFYYTAIGSDIKYGKRLVANDTWYIKSCRPVMEDVTQPGSDVRAWKMQAPGEAYGRNGSFVGGSAYIVEEAYQKFLDGTPAPSFTEKMAEWTEYCPPAHVTTDEDYDRIARLWEQEVIRGEEPLYWEDVRIGTEVPKTCSDGPITYMHINAWNPIPVWHLFNREDLKNRAYMRDVFRDRYGCYLDETALHHGGRNIPGSRMVFYNSTAAMLIARTLTNYIGNAGRISKYSWRLFPFFKELRNPDDLDAAMFMKVPGMEGRYCDRHGSEGDTVIGRAVVTDKYVNEKGEHCVGFALWAETLDGEIIQTCPSEAVLPSRTS